MKYSKCWWGVQGTEDLQRRCMFVCHNPLVRRVVTAEYCQTCELKTLKNPRSPTEICWETGKYTDECDCELCDHKHECSGYEGEE